MSGIRWVYCSIGSLEYCSLKEFDPLTLERLSTCIRPIYGVFSTVSIRRCTKKRHTVSTTHDGFNAGRAKRISTMLLRAYPEAHCSLSFASPFQLLIATILSAQCTDKRVNGVTPVLFQKWATAEIMAEAPLEEITRVVKSTGFFRAKARNIKLCSQHLVEHHNGRVPQTMNELVALPGVGRKTANVVLGTVFHTAVGVVVDTHVGRISRRLGLSCHSDAVGIEKDLVLLLPKNRWIGWSHCLIEHGRNVCLARRPHCGSCILARICPKVGVPAAVQISECHRLGKKPVST